MDETINDVMEESFERHADRAAVRVLRQSDERNERGLQYAPVTYGQIKEQRDRLASGLAQCGLAKGQRVGILVDSGLEPVLIFLAADLLGLSSVPLCSKMPDDILIHSITHSGMAVLFADSRSREQVARVLPRLENPPQVVLTEGQAEGALSFFELARKGAEAAPPVFGVGPEDECKVVYTSGTSGLPKGVVQTHRNIVANVRSIWDVMSRRDPCIIFKSAPYYHSLGILNTYYPLMKGWTLDLPRSTDRVLIDIRHSEPHLFLTVPLTLDKVYANVRRGIEAGGLQGKLIARSVRAKQRRARGEGTVGGWLVNRTVGKKVVGAIRTRLSERVGERLEVLIVGAAKADPEALDFFQDVLEIATFEGYGTTECCPLVAVNTYTGRKTGTVGKPLFEVKVVDVEGREIGYGNGATGVYRGSGEEAGELWTHGPNVMKEYLDDPEQTEAALVADEAGKVWYRTGDLFSIDEEGFLSFRGRVGRQFKLRNGEFVNPERLERLYARIPLIEHVLVCGDQARTFPLPVATVSVEEAKTQTDIPDLPLDDEKALRCHPAIHERIREQMLVEATAAGLPGHERPQRVLVLPEPLSEEMGTLTRGLRKVVPKAVASQYGDLIEQAYAG